ncbi:serine/threonine protein kinase, partial [Streptomyces sp. NPDC002690]
RRRQGRSHQAGGRGLVGPRPTGTGRRPANPRLLRQRLFVFVVVTLLVALGIAAAQGCQGPARGLGGPPVPTGSGQSAPDGRSATPLP